MSEEKSKKKKRWIPLESSYEMLNKYMTGLGVSGDYDFSDLYGFDEGLLSFVSQPVIGVLLVYPITEKNEKLKEEEEKDKSKFGVSEGGDGIYHIRQTIGNACGTIGLLHCLLNNLQHLKLEGELGEFYEKTKGLDFEKRGEALEAFNLIEKLHEETASDESTTEVRESDMKTNKHFVCFVNSSDQIVELDGRRAFPVSRGKTSLNTFLFDVAGVIMERYVKVNPENPYDFAAVVLNKK